MKLLKLLLPLLILGNIIFQGSSVNASDTLCMERVFSLSEQRKVQEIIGKLESFMYVERRDVLDIIRKLQEKTFQTEIKSNKKCLLEKALSDFESNARVTHNSHKKISQYILHPYYKNTYIPRLSKNTLSNYIFKKGTQNKEVFLTFDDGPYNINIVNYLKKEEIAGTFFLMCSRMNTDSLNAYNTPLFSLGGHTMYHDNYDELSESQVISDVDQCSQIFKQLGITHRIFRPAYGIINNAETKALVKNNLTAFIWSVDSADWAGDFTKEKAQEILENIQSGDILLFHEGVDLEVFDFLVEGLRTKGYSFGKL